MTDAELIEATRQGERDAFGMLVARYQRMVEAAVYSATGRRDLVDDVVQDTFVTAWRTIEQLRDSGRLRPWLYGIARNLAFKARRKQRRTVELQDMASSRTPFEDVSEHQRDRTIASAVARLPWRYREPLVLFYYEHCSVKEVADALAIREEAVMQRLSRARRRLGESLATNVEIELERKPSRAALAACVIALLPTRAGAAAAAGLSTAATGSSNAATSASQSGWASVAAWLAAYWRIPSAVLASAAGVFVLVTAMSHSNAVAARGSASSETGRDSAQPETTAIPPRLPDAEDSTLYRNFSVASPDAVESCARGARGVVIAALGRDAFRTRDGQLYFEPSPEIEQLANDVAARVSSTCDVGTWPELYVLCEGTAADVKTGNVDCYPYDPFATDT